MNPKHLFLGSFIITCFSPMISIGQVIINNPGKVAERQVEYRANSKIDQAVDKGLDAVEAGVTNLFKKKNKEAKPAKQENRESENKNTSNSTEAVSQEPTTEPKNTSLTAYGKLDFIPGEKVVAFEDFSQDAIGDFPANFNTKLWFCQMSDLLGSSRYPGFQNLP